MRFLFWKSQMSFREFKQKVTERKQNEKDTSSEISLSFFHIWRLFLIHSIGPTEVSHGKTGVPRYSKPRSLLIGLCFSRTQRIRFIGLASYDYLFNLFLILFFTAVFLSSRSFLAVVFGAVFYLFLQLINYARAKQLCSDIRLYLGFDSE